MMNRAGFLGRILAALGVGAVSPGGGAGLAGTGRAEISQSLGSTPDPSASPTPAPSCPRCNDTGYVKATLGQIEIYGWASESEPKRPRPKVQHMMLFCPRCRPHVYGRSITETIEEDQRRINRALLLRELDRHRR